MEPTNKPHRPSYKPLWEAVSMQRDGLLQRNDSLFMEKQAALTALSRSDTWATRWSIAAGIEALIIVALLIARYAL